MTKTILVLANSIKKYPGRCVAGLEMIPVEGGYNFGSWIRPIDPTQLEGAIPYHRTLIAQRPVLPLQCVEMDLVGSAKDPNHPEDWIMTSVLNWRHIGWYDYSVLQGLPDQTEDLWGAQSAESREVIAGTAKCTLRLIKPLKPIQVDVYHEYNSYESKYKFRKFLCVDHKGVTHRFSITDPNFEARHGIAPGKVAKDKPLRFTLDPQGVTLVVSLTPPLPNGFQYKVAAAIIEQ